MSPRKPGKKPARKVGTGVLPPERDIVTVDTGSVAGAQPLSPAIAYSGAYVCPSCGWTGIHLGECPVCECPLDPAI